MSNVFDARNIRRVALLFSMLTLVLGAFVFLPSLGAASPIPYPDNWEDSAQGPLPGGDGATAPLEVSTPEQLAFVAKMVNMGKVDAAKLPDYPSWYYCQAWYKLTADIDLSGKEWIPIGANISAPEINYFSGMLDGDGHTVRGMTVHGAVVSEKYPGTVDLGLFGMSGPWATVKNLGLLDLQVYGSGASIENVGGLVGDNQGLISTCFAIGYLQGGSVAVRVGGLAAYHLGGNAVIDQCSANIRASTSTVGDSYAGIIVGVMGNNAKVTNTSVFGVAEAASYAPGDCAGGIGGATAPNFTISTSIASVETRSNGSTYVGDFVGYLANGSGTNNTFDGNSLTFNSKTNCWEKGVLRTYRPGVGGAQASIDPARPYPPEYMTNPDPQTLTNMGLSTSLWQTVGSEPVFNSAGYQVGTNYHYPIPKALYDLSGFQQAIKDYSVYYVPTKEPTPDPDAFIKQYQHITFGSYPQTDITDSPDLANLVEGVDYIRASNGHAYKIESLTWKLYTPVDADGQALLVCDQLIDKMAFDSGNSNDWNNSSIRRWMNGTSLSGSKLDFLNEAYFAPAIYNAIVPQNIGEPQNYTFGSSIKTFATLSRAFIPSNSIFTMPSDAAAYYESDYAKALNGEASTPASLWTRTPAGADGSSLITYSSTTTGSGETTTTYWDIDSSTAASLLGIRPALVVNLNRVQLVADENGAPVGDGSVGNPYRTEPLYTAHGGYTTTTSKCATCHGSSTIVNPEDPNSAIVGSIHRGDGKNAVLGEYNPILADSAADGCAYCHIDTTASRAKLQVYNGDVKYYSDPAFKGYGHSHTGDTGNPMVDGASCVDCHMVHGSTNGTGNIYLDQMLLRAPSTKFDSAGYDKYQDRKTAADAEWRTQSKETAVSTWCVSCHAAAHDGEEDPHGKLSLTEDPLYGYTCESCHGASYGLSAWPHYVEGAEKMLLSAESIEQNSLFSTLSSFSEITEGMSEEEVKALKTQGFAQSANEDGVCLRCHRKTATSEIAKPETP